MDLWTIVGTVSIIGVVAALLLIAALIQAAIEKWRGMRGK
jgi:hypothetical protein